MHFVKLRLSGFKSFVDPTELHIHRGLTGVIGPNGCGKSNLLEAMRWVMGETSAKSMRGSGMEDVIFAGAATRPARNYAEVSLQIDNKERRAPAAFNTTDEIEISRRITRDMGSAYKHNGKEIRARDAQTLFADAATGSNSPALVRQGQISELINAKPKSRRRILEDAAGVAGLHARRHEALLRLNSAETNLQRVVEVLTQLEAREAALGREAARAKRYRTLSLDLGRAEAMLLFRRWREADRENVQARDTMERTVQIAGEATRLAAEAARKRLELEEATPKLREEDAVSRAIHQKLMMERQALETREREALATADRLARQLTQLEADLERETTIDSDAAEMLEKLTAEFEALAEMDSNSDAISSAQEEERVAETALTEVEAELDKLTGEAARIGAELEAAHARSQESGRLLAKLEQDAAEARDRQSAIDEEIETSVAGSEEAVMTAESAQEAIAAADEAAAEAETARADAQERAQTAGGATAEARGSVKALQNEIEQLDKLLSEREGARKPLLDRVRAAPGFEGALAAAVGD
ncbi:MAG: AAA family ATPase, partial [Rhodobacteraceae bacterium]|nr:AAA family ATPase [Paracoccaceae bacterium]